MRFDVADPTSALKQIPDFAHRAEELSAAGLRMSENQKN